jgi:putative DNA primase/helicase
MAECPECSGQRSTAHKRRSHVLAITLIEPDFAIYYCNHCEVNGYCRPGRTSSVVNLAERKRQREQAARQQKEDEQQRIAGALKIFDECQQPCLDSPGKAYFLVTRGIDDLDQFDLDDLRFHSACPFDRRLPAIVALIRNVETNEPQGIHCTALDLSDPAKPQRIKDMKWSRGLVAGGAIKFGKATDRLLIGEGIETTLSAALVTELRPCWSVISKSGVAKFVPPRGITHLTVAVDNDAAGQSSADELVERLTSNGIEVTTVKPTTEKDFNDLLRATR